MNYAAVSKVFDILYQNLFVEFVLLILFLLLNKQSASLLLISANVYLFIITCLTTQKFKRFLLIKIRKHKQEVLEIHHQLTACCVHLSAQSPQENQTY